MKKRFLALGLAIMLLAGLLLSGCSIAISAQDARKGVVRVYKRYITYYCDYETYVSTKKLSVLSYEINESVGSAFGVGKTGGPTNIFVTNRHVVEVDETLYKGTLSSENSPTGEATDVVYFDQLDGIYILHDDYAYMSGTFDNSRASVCTILYQADDDEADVAVLQCADTLEDRMALPLLDTDYELDAGDEVIALGYPVISDDDNLLASVEHVTMTEGKISLLHSDTLDGVTSDVITHTATINGGNSGGPLITPTGEVAGINTYTVNPSSGTSTNNSLEIKYVMNALDDLKIDYDVRKPGYSMTVIIGAAVAAVVVIAVIVLLAVRKKPKPAPRIVNNNNPAPIPAPSPAPYSNPVPNNSSYSSSPDSGMRIQGISGEFANRRFAIKGQLRIGHDPERNDLVYPAKTPGVSRVHCMLTYENGRLYLEDLGSSYGTFLANGRPLPRGQRVEMHIGDKFSLGTQKETFVITGRGGL